MNIIVFSYNRALQLQAFLKSLHQYLKAEQMEVNVIYNSGGGDYETSYLALQAEFPNVIFTRRHKINSVSPKYFFTYKKNLYRYFKHANLRTHLTNFKQLLEGIVAGSRFETVAFFTDDSIFYRDLKIDSSILDEVASDKMFKTVYSLRHGVNMYPAPANIKPYKTNHCIWEVVPSAASLAHWTHVFSIDGHVYPRQMLLPIFKKLNYINPNSFEGFVNNYMSEERTGFSSRLIFDKQNSLIGFELNKVQTFADNNNMNFSVEELNKKFMDGFSLQYLYDEDEITDFRPHLSGINFVHNVTGAQEYINFDARLVNVFA
jgi:hypothetical protein